MTERTRSIRRSRGEGGIYRTSDGRLRGTIVLSDPDGTRSVKRYVSGRTRAEVVGKLDELRREAERGFPTGGTTGEFLTRWVADVRPSVRAATHREYARHVRDYWASLSAIPLTRLTHTHVERVMRELQDRGLSSTTVRSARTTLRRALQDAMRASLVTRNVAALARPPRAERREMRALTAREVGRFVEATRDDELGPLFATAIGTGLRLGELLGLEWTDVDPDYRSLTVRRSLSRTHDGGWELAEPKTARSRRTVMLASIAADALRRQRARQAAERLAAGTAWQDSLGLVFTDAAGRAYRPSSVSRAFRERADRLGLDVRFHDLRHTAATLLLVAGVPLKIVSETLGHTSIVVTADLYQHVTPDMRREAAEAMDRVLA